MRILHLLGVEGPKAPQPSKYIRYIYNRVVLENAIVRAAAVSSLAKFGVNVPDLGVKSSIKVLLTRYASLVYLCARMNGTWLLQDELTDLQPSHTSRRADALMMLTTKCATELLST